MADEAVQVIFFEEEIKRENSRRWLCPEDNYFSDHTYQPVANTDDDSTSLAPTLPTVFTYMSNSPVQQSYTASMLSNPPLPTYNSVNSTTSIFSIQTSLVSSQLSNHIQSTEPNSPDFIPSDISFSISVLA